MLKNNIFNEVKVLITTGIFPPDIGGPATQLDYLIKEVLIRKPSFKINVLTFGEKGADYPYDVYKISKKIPKILKSFSYLMKTFILILQNDTIYAWDLYTAGFSSYLIKKIIPRKKLVIRFVGDSAWEYYFNKFSISNPEGEQVSRGAGFQFSIPDDILKFQEKKYGFKIEFKKWLRKKMLMSADIVVVPSEFMKSIALKIGFSENKIRLIYNSVDFLFDEKEINEFENTSNTFYKKELGFKEDAIYLVSASRLVPWKGQSALIETMPDLIKKYGDIFLFIIGDGLEFNNLKFQISNLKLENNVFLTGRLSHGKVFEYFKCADVFILNTFYEGLSHTLLEAMKIGIPIIASRAGGNMELIEDGENGFLVEYNNKQEITNAILKIIQNPGLKERFAARSKQKLNQFNFNDLVNKTIEILK